MKKKGPREIPSFATTRNKPAPKPDQLNPKVQPPPPPKAPAIKPQATSSKSGRRGT